MLVPAVVTITLALILYTIGVWGERVQGILKPWHAVFFGLGLTADATGTVLMTRIADTRRAQDVSPGGLNTLMAVSGTLALLLMAIHLGWAIAVLIRDREPEKVTFHRFSVAVWAIWLIPYLAGAVAAMAGTR
ncbi:MAG: HsmA family protein [Dermatophilaceae bacterium]